MKLDSLIAQDNLSINPSEWECQLELGPLKGSVPCTLLDANLLPNGDVFLVFTFTALLPMTFIGYRITRAWVDDSGTIQMRTVRSDVWTPANVLTQASTLTIEAIIEPKDWA